MLLPRNPALISGTSYPQGHGYALLKESPDGTVRIVGVLGDGTPSLASGVTQAGLPFYYTYKTAALSPEPSLSSLNPASATSAAPSPGPNPPRPPIPPASPIPMASKVQYPPSVPVTSRPPRGALPLNFGNITDGSTAGALAIGGSTLTPITPALLISPSDRVTFTPPDPAVHLTLDRSTGYLSGSFRPPGIGHSWPSKASSSLTRTSPKATSPTNPSPAMSSLGLRNAA